MNPSALVAPEHDLGALEEAVRAASDTRSEWLRN